MLIGGECNASVSTSVQYAVGICLVRSRYTCIITFVSSLPIELHSCVPQNVDAVIENINVCLVLKHVPASYQLLSY